MNRFFVPRLVFCIIPVTVAVGVHLLVVRGAVKGGVEWV